jgi:hypothetical protein
MAYGFLYHLTGEKKYIAMSKEAMDIAYSGACDESKPDYSWKKPESYLRGGPSLGMFAMGYDMCFDIWEPAYREKVAKDLLNYDVQGGAYRVTMKQMVQGGNHGPESNHHGSALGGAGLSMLAINGDSNLDQKLIDQYLATVEQRILELFQKGMGDTGWFWEGPGPGQIASDTSFIPMLQAFRIAAGKDYPAGMPGPRALVERWIGWLMLRPETAQPIYANTETSWSMGGYGGRTFGRYGLTRGGSFAQGFGLFTHPDDKAALLWTYKNIVEPSEQKDYTDYQLNGKPSYDAINLPHRAVLSFINWPIGLAPKNPEGITPKTRGDKSRMGYCWFRNGWKDKDDIFVGVQMGSRGSGGGGGRGKGRGGGGGGAEDIAVWGLGERHAFGPISRHGAPDGYQGYQDGSGFVSSQETAVAVDFSRASGADGVVIVLGAAAASYRLTGNKQGKSKFTSVQLGGKPCGVLVLSASGKFPDAVAGGDKLTVGDQTFTLAGGKFNMAKTAAAQTP